MRGRAAKSAVTAAKLKAIKEGTIFVAGYNNVFLSVYYCTLLRAIAISIRCPLLNGFSTLIPPHAKMPAGCLLCME